jgi:hypothetical protein
MSGSPAVAAGPVDGPNRIRWPVLGLGILLGAAGGRLEGLVGGEVIPELVVAQAAKGLRRPHLLVDVGSLAPALPPA